MILWLLCDGGKTVRKGDEEATGVTTDSLGGGRKTREREKIRNTALFRSSRVKTE